MAKTSPKKKVAKKVATKKPVSKKKVAKKAAKKSTAQKRVQIQKNQTPRITPPNEPVLSEKAYTLHLALGQRNFTVKRETVPEIVDVLKKEIGSIMNIKTRGDIVVEQEGRKANITMFVFPLKRLIFANGEVAKNVFAKRVAIALA